MSERTQRPGVVVLLGLLCAGAGLILLLASLDVWRPSLAWAAPLALVATGVALLLTARAGPGGGKQAG